MSDLIILQNGKELDSMIGFVSEVRPTIVVSSLSDYTVECHKGDSNGELVLPHYNNNGVWVFHPIEYNSYIIEEKYGNTILRTETVLIHELPFYQEIDWCRIKYLDVGTTLNIPIKSESNPYLEFIVVNQGNPDSTIYDSTCDGTWVLLKYPLEYYNILNSLENRYYSSADYKRSVLSSAQDNQGCGFYDYFINNVSYSMRSSYSWLDGVPSQEDTQSGFFRSLLVDDVYNNLIMSSKIPHNQVKWKTPLSEANQSFILEKDIQMKIFHLSAYELSSNIENISDFAGKLPHRDGSVLSYFNNNDMSYVYNKNNVTQRLKWWTRTPLKGFNQWGAKNYGDAYQLVVNYDNNNAKLSSNISFFDTLQHYGLGANETSRLAYFRPAFILDRECFYRFQNGKFYLTYNEIKE